MDEYEVIRYAADGHPGEVDVLDPWYTEEAVAFRGTLAECRQAIADHLAPGYTLAEARWDGLDGDLEAYYESPQEGCGAWAIRAAR